MEHKPIRVEGLNPEGISRLQSLIKIEAKQNHFHRIEVEHALRLANLNAETTNEILVEGFQANISKLQDVHYAINDLKEAVVDGFAEAQRSLYQLHLDNVGIQSVLSDILSCMLDKEEFKRELQRRKDAELVAHHYWEAKNEYTDALELTKRALAESNRGKASAMLDEALHLFIRAAKENTLALNANFQIGYLYQTYKSDLDAAAAYYDKSLGTPYSPHNVRTLLHLAHVHYCKGKFDLSCKLMTDLVKHMNRLDDFALALKRVAQTDWPTCMDALEETFATYADVLPRSTTLSSITAWFQKDRRFTATENFMANFTSIECELHRLRPDFKVLFDGSRYAARCGDTSTARAYLQDIYERLPNDNARRVMILEAIANPDLQNA
ncbi:MAG: tetratricopeptide repeat protein [Phycisphaerales bacterium]